jgi:hypothetical protein
MGDQATCEPVEELGIWKRFGLAQHFGSRNPTPVTQECAVGRGDKVLLRG